MNQKTAAHCATPVHNLCRRKSAGFSGIVLVLLLPVLHGVGGCTVGTPAASQGESTFPGPDNRLQQTYEVDYHEAVRAGLNSLTASKALGSWQMSDEPRTILKATRQDGTTVTIEIVGLEPGLTRVDVLAENLDVWDEGTSRKFQESISNELSQGQGAYPVVLKPSKKKIVRRSVIRSEPTEQDSTGSEPASIQELASTAAGSATEKVGEKRPEELGGSVTQDQDDMVSFQSNSNGLQVQEMKKLDTVAAKIANRPEAAVTLRGYPDSSENPEYGILLAQGRANAVKLYLMSKGIHPDRIAILAVETSALPGEGEKPLGSVTIEFVGGQSTD